MLVYSSLININPSKANLKSRRKQAEESEKDRTLTQVSGRENDKNTFFFKEQVLLCSGKIHTFMQIWAGLLRWKKE